MRHVPRASSIRSGEQQEHALHPLELAPHPVRQRQIARAVPGHGLMAEQDRLARVVLTTRHSMRQEALGHLRPQRLADPLQLPASSETTGERLRPP
jgi:hypothetical protein